MAKPPEPLFLARETYRMRRRADAARLLPIMGLVLLLLAVFWKTTAGAMIYIFSVWALLIVVIWALSRSLPDVSGDAPKHRADETTER